MYNHGCLERSSYDEESHTYPIVESENTKFGKQDFALQSLPQKVFSAIWAVESEVNNGGFSQYFLNSSAETTPFVVEALRTVGAPDTAFICERAISAAFPVGLPKTVNEIGHLAAEFSEETLEQLEGLDQEFFSYPNNLMDLLFDYVSKHPEEFAVLPMLDDL